MRSGLPLWAQLLLAAYALLITWKWAVDVPARGHVFERATTVTAASAPAVSHCPRVSASSSADHVVVPCPTCVCPKAQCHAPAASSAAAADAAAKASAAAAAVAAAAAASSSTAVVTLPASCPVCAVSREPSFALTEHIQGHWRRGHPHATLTRQPSFARVHELVYGPTPRNVYAAFQNWAHKSRPSDYSHTHLTRPLLDRLLAVSAAAADTDGGRKVVPRFIVEVGSMHGGSAQVFAAWLHDHGYGPTTTAAAVAAAGATASGAGAGSGAGSGADAAGAAGATGSAAANSNPNAVTVLCIDTFLGDQNMWLKNIAWEHLAVQNGRPTTFEQFMWNIAGTPYTRTIVPFPVTSLLGARFLHTVLLAPNVVYLDSAHEIDETFQELCLYWFLLPGGGLLFGDDYHWEGVGPDVRRFVADRQRNHPTLQLEVEQSSNTWILRKPDTCQPHSMC